MKNLQRLLKVFQIGAGEGSHLDRARHKLLLPSFFSLKFLETKKTPNISLKVFAFIGAGEGSRTPTPCGTRS